MHTAAAAEEDEHPEFQDALSELDCGTQYLLYLLYCTQYSVYLLTEDEHPEFQDALSRLDCVHAGGKST